MTELEKLIQIHQKASSNLVEFYRICLSDPEEYKAPAPFHYQISDILLNDNRHFAIEMFRESAKSTYVLKSFPIYRLTYPKKEERYIIIIKQNQELASAKILEIINEYEHNEVLNKNLIQIHKKSARAIEVTVRGFNRENIQIRIEAYGKGSSIRGLAWGNIRPQVVILDDVQDLEDSQSETTLEKDWNWFLSDVKFLAKTGRIFMIGNNLGANCIIERTITSGEMGFETLKISAINEKGESTWPEQFSTEFLKSEKEEFIRLGKLDIWYRERMCQAIAPETQIFKEEYFQFFNEEDLPEEFDIDIVIDPAISKRKEACNTAMVAVAKSSYSPNWYVNDYKVGKFNPYEMLQNLYSMLDQFAISYPNSQVRVWIEGVAYQEALKYVFEEEMRRNRKYFFVDTFIDKQDKDQRIKGLVPMFRTGVLYFRSWMTELKEEALTYPAGKTKDIIDALALQMHIKYPTMEKREEKKLTRFQQAMQQISEIQNDTGIDKAFL